MDVPQRNIIDPNNTEWRHAYFKHIRTIQIQNGINQTNGCKKCI